MSCYVIHTVFVGQRFNIQFEFDDDIIITE